MLSAAQGLWVVHWFPELLSHGCEVVLINRGSRPVDHVQTLVADRNDPDALAEASRTIEAADAVIDTCAYTAKQVEIAWELFGMSSPPLGAPR